MTQTATLIRQKKLSCVEVMTAYLDRIESINPKINAVVQYLSREQAINSAKTADVAIAKQRPLGHLHGIPITQKNGYKAKGFDINLGNNSPLDGKVDENNTLLQRLLDAGAILLGITNTPEYLMGFASDNLRYGRSNNPYDLSRTPGGSSGGQAASIAAGCCAFGIGTDGGGSIRQPAHNCGIAALKTTWGLLSYAGGWPVNGIGIMNNFVVAGPMARAVDDLILSLPIIAGPDGIDPNVAPVSLGNPQQVKLADLRVAFFTDNGCTSSDSETIATIDNVIRSLKGKVKSIKQDYPKAIKEYSPLLEEVLFYGCDGGQWALNMKENLRVTGPNSQEFDELLARAKLTKTSLTEFRERLVKVNQFRYAMMDFMRDYDVLITPVATAPAKKHDQVYAFKEGLDLTFNVPFNVTGWPAAVVRCGTSKDGLPIGVQIVAQGWRDDIALAVAKFLEKTFGGYQAPFFGDAR